MYRGREIEKERSREREREKERKLSVFTDNGDVLRGLTTHQFKNPITAHTGSEGRCVSNQPSLS